MNYSIFDSTGNLVASFDNETEARRALQEIADSEPGAAHDIALFAFEDDGTPVGEAIHPRMPVRGNPGWWIERSEALSEASYDEIPERVIPTPPLIAVPV